MSAENKITKTVGTSFSVLDDCVVHNGCILCAAAVLWAMTVFAVLCCDMGSLIFGFYFNQGAFPGAGVILCGQHFL